MTVEKSLITKDAKIASSSDLKPEHLKQVQKRDQYMSEIGHKFLKDMTARDKKKMDFISKVDRILFTEYVIKKSWNFSMISIEWYVEIHIIHTHILLAFTFGMGDK